MDGRHGDIEPRIGGRCGRPTAKAPISTARRPSIRRSSASIRDGCFLPNVKSPGLRAAIGQTWTVIYFEPVDGGRTKVTVKMLGFSGDAESQKMRAFFEVGNKATLDALVKRFATR